MLVALTEDQEFFRETTERFLVEQASPDTVRALRDDPAGFDEHGGFHHRHEIVTRQC